MTSNLPAYIITTFHFGREPEAKEAFQRLLKSIKRSYEELDTSGGLILVASGDRAMAADAPTVVKESLGREPANVYCVNQPGTVRSVQALNAGIFEAIRRSADSDNAIIGLVQSSSFVSPGWLGHVSSAFQKNTDAHTVFGRILQEEKPERIFADGHLLTDGRVRWMNHNSAKTHPYPSSTELFPCLSTCAFRRSAVQQVIEKYGSFVTECFDHYGDCLDVSLRVADANPKARFFFEGQAVSYKRRPVIAESNLRAAHMAAWALYYSHSPMPYDCDADAVEAAERILCREYSSKAEPPSADYLERNIKLHREFVSHCLLPTFPQASENEQAAAVASQPVDAHH